MIVDKNLTVDLNRVQPLSIIKIHEGDTNSIRLVLSITKDNTSVDLTGLTVKYDAVIANTLAEQDAAGSVDGSRVIIPVTRNMTANYAWYTQPNQGYSLTGTYSLVGNFCTINGTAPLIEGWETVYYSLPVGSLFSASTIAHCGGDTYSVVTNSIDNVSVVEIRKIGGGTMSSGSISFTLRYRYSDE